MSWSWRLCVFFLSVSLCVLLLFMNPLTVHHMDDVIMCCDWDPDPSRILESHKVTFFAINDIISKLRPFSGGKFTEVSVWRTDCRGNFFFNTNTWWFKVLCRWQTLFFGVEIWWRVSKTDRRTDRKTNTFPHNSAVFFPKGSDSYYVTFVWSCNVALSDISLYLVEYRTCVVIKTVWLTCPCNRPPPYPFTLIWFANTAPLILSPYRHMGGEKNFTPSRLQDFLTEEEAENWHRIPCIQTSVWMG